MLKRMFKIKDNLDTILSSYKRDMFCSEVLYSKMTSILLFVSSEVRHFVKHIKMGQCFTVINRKIVKKRVPFLL
jgi:hypothetical protein